MATWGAFEIVRFLLLCWKKMTKKVYKYDLSYSEAHNYLKKKFPKCHIQILDVSKKTCNWDILQSISKLVPIKYKKYEKEKFDCDDFARVAWGLWGMAFPQLSVGFCLIHTPQGNHAANCVLYRNGSKRLSFAFIEPQTNRVFRSTKWDPYLIVI